MTTKAEEQGIPTLEGSIEEVNASVLQITKMDSAIVELEETYAKFVPQVDDPAGMEDAKKARLEIREPRYAIENLRKAAKAPLLEAGRQLDSRANAMKARLLAIEEPIHNAIREEEDRKAREKQEAIEREAKRVEDIQARIGSIKATVEQVIYERAGSDRVQRQIDSIEKLNIDESFEEFRERAQDAKDATLRKLSDLLTEAKEREEEQAKIDAEREELRKLRAEQEEREAEERKRRGAEEAERRAKEKADREKLERENEELRKEQEKLRKAQEAEEKRQADERAKREKAEADRKAAEEREKKNKFPGKSAIVKALTEHFGVSQLVARLWLDKLAEK